MFVARFPASLPYMPPELADFLAALERTFMDGSLVKLTLVPRTPNAEPTLRRLVIRPVALRAGPRLAMIFHHATRDETHNLPLDAARQEIANRLTREFGRAYLFTTAQVLELERSDSGEFHLRRRPPEHATPADWRHDRVRHYLLDPRVPWLAALGVTHPDGRVRESRAAKFRQIQKFTEILSHQLTGLPIPRGEPVRLVDMGCGKGYLTFAAWDWLHRSGWKTRVRGIEARQDLVDSANRIARQLGCEGLEFETGTIASAALPEVEVLVALHACDTATDDALARGVQAGVAVILAAPCCHKELRPQLRAGPPLDPLLRHGILRERQAELVTDALRAALLEWAGYATQVFEFVSPEHTAKNLMIAARRRVPAGPAEGRAGKVRALAAAFGLRTQRLASLLGFPLVEACAGTAKPRTPDRA